MTDANTTNHIPEDDLVLFALQLLPEDRMRQTKKHVDTCELCRSEISKLQGDLVAYSMTADIQLPPPDSRERLMRQIAKEPRLAPAEPEPPPVVIEERPSPPVRGVGEPMFPTRQSRTLRTELPEEEPEERRRPGRAPWVLAWTGWALAAGCSFVAGLQLHQRQQIQSSMNAVQARLGQIDRKAAWQQDALSTLTAANALQMPLHTTAALKPAAAAKPSTAATAPPPPPPQALVAYLAEKGALVFIGTHMDPAPAGKTYELWLIPADGRNPMPAGTFKPDAQGGASVVMPQLPRGVPAKSFGVTVENDGGSDTPTAPVIMTGA